MKAIWNKEGNAMCTDKDPKSLECPRCKSDNISFPLRCPTCGDITPFITCKVCGDKAEEINYCDECEYEWDII